MATVDDLSFGCLMAYLPSYVGRSSAALGKIRTFQRLFISRTYCSNFLVVILASRQRLFRQAELNRAVINPWLSQSALLVVFPAWVESARLGECPAAYPRQ